MTQLGTGYLPCPWDFDPDACPPNDDCPPPPSELGEPAVPPHDEPAPEPFGCTLTARPPMKMLTCAHLAIMRHLTAVVPEAGGMLLGPKDSSIVTHYVPDEQGRPTASSFTLDAVGLNRILKRFLACGLDAKGLVHSHPRGCTVPSGGDLAYVHRSFCNPNNKGVAEFLLPIVCDGQFYPYIVVAGPPSRVLSADLLLF